MKSHQRTHLHGVLMDGYTPCLRVLSAAELERLPRLSETPGAVEKPSDQPIATT
jgi:hypothetical protein